MTCSGFSLCPFRTMEYIRDLLPYPSPKLHYPPPTYTIPPPHIFCAPKVFFYAQTQCSFVTHTHIYKRYFPLLFAGKKHDNFHIVNMTVHGKGSTQNVFAPNLFSECKEERRGSEICCPTQRNVTFILHCTVFD